MRGTTLIIWSIIELIPLAIGLWHLFRGRRLRGFVWIVGWLLAMFLLYSLLLAPHR